MKLKKTDVLEKSLEELHCVVEAYRDNFHTTAYTPADYDFLIYNLKLHTKKLVGELKKKRRQAKKKARRDNRKNGRPDKGRNGRL